MSDFVDEHEKVHAKPTQAPAPQTAEPAQPTTVAASAAAPSDLVLTKWMINYGAVLGRRKDPTRTSADQLIVDELKIQSGASKPQILKGGNAARSGRVHLGDATVPRGSGSVAAVVRYGARSSFSVRLSLSPAPTRAERIKLRGLQARATTRALEEASTEGDYAAIAAALEKEFAGEFSEGSTLHVEVVPAKPLSEKEQGIDPQEAEFTADGPSSFEVMVEPGDVTRHTNPFTKATSGEEAEAQSHTSGSKISTENSVARKETQAKEFQTKFVTELSNNVTRAFKLIEQGLDDETKEHIHRHEETVQWKVGVGPEKADGKPSDPSKTSPAPQKKSGGGGILSKAWNAVSKGAGWVYRKAKGAVKKIPIVGTALSLVGDIWDTVTGRASVDRTSSETDGDTDSTKQHHQSSSGMEIQNLDVIASKLTNELVTNQREELETMIATKFGTEVTLGDRQDTTKKSTVNTSYTTHSTVYEASRPKLVVKKLG